MAYMYLSLLLQRQGKDFDAFVHEHKRWVFLRQLEAGADGSGWTQTTSASRDRLLALERRLDIDSLGSEQVRMLQQIRADLASR
jgi:hypothetical protein